jgi:nitrate/TMAO reductase-like tetraheme cytochrome c subunit
MMRISKTVILSMVFLSPAILAAAAEDPLEKYYAESNYPSAAQCAECHQQIYNEWASSNHAYASISPMFHKFEQKINDLTQGTIGSFCVRCHQQVGTQRGEERHLPLWDRSRVASEGVTCITCHRVEEEYGKVNGERTIIPGDIHTPVGGTMRDSVFNGVLQRKGELKIATSAKERGSKIHAGVYKFEQLGQSEFCASCHQVAVNLGIKLEVVWDQYRDSPAFRKGVTCQDCHMGKVPGRADGYETGPSAVVNGVPINPNRRHSNHSFYGPGYPIAHPGIFPHNPQASRWTMQEWLQFDYRSRWGSKEFESSIEKYAAAFDDLNAALKAFGGDVAALNALTALEGAIGRGQTAFRRKDAVERLTSAVESLKNATDVAAIDKNLATLRKAATALAEPVKGSKSAAAPRSHQRLLASIEAMAATAREKAGGFAKAYENVNSAFKSVTAAKDDAARGKAVESLASAVAALRKTIPGADNAFSGDVAALRASMGVNFPFAWLDPIDREEAWAIVEKNIKSLEHKKQLRRQVMENGSRIDGPFFASELKAGNALKFKYVVTNTDDGHNLPSGSLGAQPEIWLNVALIDPDGKNVWESGYVDRNGDFADLHSLELAAGRIEHDKQLFNLQTKFLTTNVKGTDREMYLPVNFDIDQLPFLRPPAVPTTVLNHPPFVRMEGRSLPPLGSRDAVYEVPAELIKKPGKYRLAVRLRSRAEPIYFMRFVGATTEMEEAMNQWMLDIHPYTVEFQVK